MEHADVVILGGGVAGLFAAYELKKQRFQGTIVILEQGLDAGKRFSGKTPDGDALHGVGGPGFFTDGKICLHENAGTRLTSFVNNGLLQDSVNYIQTILSEFIPGMEHYTVEIDEWARQELKSTCNASGLDLALSYPIVHLGTEQVRNLAFRFENFLREQGVYLLTKALVQKIAYDHDEIEICFNYEGVQRSLSCQYLIAAVGKSGHSWLCEQLREPLEARGHQLTPNVADIGIRLEFPKTVTLPLMNTVPNPRITLKRPDGAYVRTHCWCHGGRISTYRYRDTTLVDGETLKNSPTPYTGVNLLYHFSENTPLDYVQEVHRILDTIVHITRGRPVMQQLGALRGDQHLSSQYSGSASSELFYEAQIDKLFPQPITGAFLDFIERLAKLYPGINDSSTLLFAPVIEWDTYRIPVDEHMCTPIPRLYAVGDGAGLSQGVVPAATCGLLAARHVCQSHACLSRELAGVLYIA